MKRKIRMLLCIAAAVLCFAAAGVTASRAEESAAPLYYIAFDSPYYHNAIGNAYGFDKTEYLEVTDSALVKGAVRLTFEKSPYEHMGTYSSKGYKGEFDPYFCLPLYEIEEDILCSEAVSFVVTVRVPETADHSERAMAFFDTDENPGIDGNGDFFSATGAYQDTAEFQNIVFNAPGGQWSGILQSLRIDPFARPNDAMDYIDVAGVAFFSDRKAAKAFDGNYAALAGKEEVDAGAPKESAFLLPAAGCLAAAFGFSGLLREKKARRIALLMLAALLTAGLAAGCAPTEKQEGSPGSGTLSGETAASTEEPLPDAFVRAGENEEYRYDVYERHIVITKYIGNQTHVTVPDRIEGLPVTVIGYKAFFRNYCFAAQDAKNHKDIGIESLVLPDTVEILEDYALAGMEEAVSVHFGSGLRVIGDDAVQNCFLLEDLTFSGNALESIGAWAFTNCRALKNLTLPESVKTVGNAAFMCCRSLETLEIPETAEVGKGVRFACTPMK